MKLVMMPSANLMSTKMLIMMLILNKVAISIFKPAEQYAFTMILVH